MADNQKAQEEEANEIIENYRNKIDLKNAGDVLYTIEAVDLPTEFQDESFDYEEVPIDDHYAYEGEETLEDIIRNIKDSEKAKQGPSDIPPAEIIEHVELADDFVRNFLLKMKLYKTLDCFQNEVYDEIQINPSSLLARQEMSTDDIELTTNVPGCGKPFIVPTALLECDRLENENNFLKTEIVKYTKIADELKEKFISLKRERDFHRLNHRRVAQEKNFLVTKIKKFKDQFEQYKPLMEDMKVRCTKALVERHTMEIQRDKAVTELLSYKAAHGDREAADVWKLADPTKTQERLKDFQELERILSKKDTEKLQYEFVHPLDSSWGKDRGFNPLLNLSKIPRDLSHLKVNHELRIHEGAVTCVRYHPTENLVVSCSDDQTWKITKWSEENTLTSGIDEAGWLSSIDINMKGDRIVTGSGSSHTRIWNANTGKRLHTFAGHIGQVWEVNFHSCGNFFASASSDSKIRVFDLNSQRCRTILRHHNDSVNSVQFLYFSHLIVSGSSDKVVALWDGRTAHVEQMFIGHKASINSTRFSLRGDSIISCDASGTALLWDLRTLRPRQRYTHNDCINCVEFNTSAPELVFGLKDGHVEFVDVEQKREPLRRSIHDGGTLSISVNHRSTGMVTSGNNQCIAVWQ
ncbi:hypothetical protein SNEBB_006291 [Seison nebaliae]|nr:hypothetical protein SNEBB_006291 [Seison nebaliae]